MKGEQKGGGVLDQNESLCVITNSLHWKQTLKRTMITCSQQREGSEKEIKRETEKARMKERERLRQK